MISHAKEYEFQKLIDVDYKTTFVIPKYQREYVWGKGNWEHLYDDITENEVGHFLGSIICVNLENDGLQPAELNLIDGQQRFTTLSLFMAALYSLKEDSFDRASLQRRLVNDNTVRLRLSVQNNNEADYRHMLTSIGLLTDPASPFAGVRRIVKCFNYFQSRILDDVRTESGEIDAPKLDVILQKVYRSVMVKIEVRSNSDAFTLFETINNRGTPLSAIELIKNKIMSTLEAESEGQIDNVFQRWLSITKGIPDAVWQERFLRHYMNVFVIGDPKKRVTKSKLIAAYDDQISSRAQELFDDLCTKANVYSYIIEPSSALDGQSDSKALEQLQRVQAAPSYSFLLWLFDNQSLDDRLKEEIVAILVSYFVRRNLVNYPATRELDVIFLGLIQYLKDLEKDITPDDVRTYLSTKERCAPDSMFETQLVGPIYDENASITRFILCSIEERNQTKENLTDFWARKGKQGFVWTIEHILPQSSNLNMDWVNMLGDGDEEKAKAIHKSHVHNLGNLTLSGYNSTLSNGPFKDKRDQVHPRTKKPVGFRNGLHLNEDVYTQDVWTKEHIEERTEKLAKEALEMFSL